MLENKLLYIRRYIEQVEKEAILRAKWNIEHEAQIQGAATLRREPTNYKDTDALKYITEAGMFKLTLDNNNANCYRRTKRIEDKVSIQGIKSLQRGHTIIDLGLGDTKNDPKLARPDTDLRPEPVMRPVEPNLRWQLYKKKPHRLSYLAARNELSPEDKYYFCECSNWEYGWRLNDSKLLEIKKSRYGCKYETNKFFSSVGPQPDPAYYRSAHELSNICGLDV